MFREFVRKTIAKEAAWNGVGLHSGAPVTLTAQPGSDGIRFRCQGRSVSACPEAVSGTERCTQLGPISTVEHLMSALSGLEITDVDVELTAPELPSLDGSALPYVEGLLAAGIQQIGLLRVEGPFARVYVKDGDAKVAIGLGEGHWRFHLVSRNRWPGDQEFECALDPELYARAIAPARTWAFEEQVEPVLAAGFAKGLDWGSALVIGAEGYANEARFADEPVRHKMLDLIGDLALSGVPARAVSVSATASGHRLHVEAARLLAEAVKIERV